MNRIMQQSSLPVFGDGCQQRAFTYVADLVSPIVSAPFVKEAAGQAFNVGASQPVSVRDLATIVCKEFGVEPKIEHLAPRNEVHLAWSDHSQCERVFGKCAETPLQEGIRLMASWARTVGARTSNTFDEIEIKNGLPPSWQT